MTRFRRRFPCGPSGSFYLACFAVLFFPCLSTLVVGEEGAHVSTSPAFAQAKSLFLQQDFKPAAKKFWEVAISDEALAPEALLYLSRCRVKLEDMPTYLSTVSELDRRFPNSPMTASALWEWREAMQKIPGPAKIRGSEDLGFLTNSAWLDATLLRRFPTSEYAAKVAAIGAAKVMDRLPVPALPGFCADYIKAVVSVNFVINGKDPVEARETARSALITAQRSLSGCLEQCANNSSPLNNSRKTGFEKDLRHLPDLWLKLYESLLPKIEPWTARNLLKEETRANPFPRVVDYCRSQLDLINMQLVTQLKQQGEKAIQDKRYPDAQTTFRKLLAEFPDDPETSDYARKRLQETGMTILKSDKSIADLIAQADSKLRFLKQTEAEVLYRRVYDSHRDLEGAESLLLKIAKSQKERKDFDSALKSLDELLTTHPESSVVDDALFEKAVLVGCQMKKRDEGIALLKQLLSSRGTSDRAPDAQYMLGYLYLTVDETEQAKQAFNDLLARYPNSPRVQWAKKDMEALGR